MIKILVNIVIILFICKANSLLSQYYTPAQLNTIKNTRSANEGDLYLDTLGRNFYIGLTTGELARIGDTLDETIDTIFVMNDLFTIVEGKDTLFISLDSLGDNDWYKIGTNRSPSNISDSIYTAGDVQITNYPNTRADDTSTYLNTLYTDANGNIKSGRREIIPPPITLDISTSSSGNTFNYYNHYATQMTNMGLTPISISNLDFYVSYFDNLVFSGVSINASGVLTYNVISSSPRDNRIIYVVFYTK